MNVAVKYQAPSQRRGYRVTVPIHITLHGHAYKTIDWSTTGFKIGDYHGNDKPGDIIPITIYIPFQGFNVGFPAKAHVVRLAPHEDALAGEFQNLNEREKELLSVFINSILRGEMEEVEGIIRRLDIPVTPASLLPDNHATPQEKQIEEQRRRTGSIIYGVAGAVVTLLLLIVAYTNIFQMKIDSAIMYSPTDMIVAPTTGDVATIEVFENDVVKSGDSLITLTDIKLEKEINLAALRLQEATIAVNQAESVAASNTSTNPSEPIVSEEWKASQAAIKTLEQKFALKQQTLERSKKLYEQGIINQLRLDNAYDEYLQTEQALYKARQESSRLQSNLTSSEEALESAKQLQEVARSQLAILEEQRLRLTLKAPADGIIRKLLVNEASPVKYGETVLIFERSNQKQTHAFITHQQALSVEAGGEATVYFPSADITIPHKVASIDTITQSLNKESGLYSWQPENSKTVTVNLDPADENALKELATLAPGTPAIVIFDRNPISQTFSTLF